MDAAGKDSAIKHVFSGINPQGCHVTSFKAPSQEELDHDYLWRCFRALPERGRIGIFNRSYYEEVLVVRVHDELLAAAEAPAEARHAADLGRALRGHPQLRALPGPQRDCHPQVLPARFARGATEAVPRSGSTSRRRTGSLPPGDVRERAHWNEYMRAYGQMIRHTATELRALVRGAGRSQVVHAAGRSPRRSSMRCPRCTCIIRA